MAGADGSAARPGPARSGLAAIATVQPIRSERLDRAAAGLRLEGDEHARAAGDRAARGGVERDHEAARAARQRDDAARRRHAAVVLAPRPHEQVRRAADARAQRDVEPVRAHDRPRREHGAARRAAPTAPPPRPHVVARRLQDRLRRVDAVRRGLRDDRRRRRRRAVPRRRVARQASRGPSGTGRPARRPTSTSRSGSGRSCPACPSRRRTRSGPSGAGRSRPAGRPPGSSSRRCSRVYGAVTTERDLHARRGRRAPGPGGCRRRARRTAGRRGRRAGCRS